METNKVVRIKAGLYVDQNASIIRFDQDRGTALVRVLKGFKNGGQAMWVKFDDIDFDYDPIALTDISDALDDAPIEETHTESGSFARELPRSPDLSMSRRDRIII